jgi:hypothetical protein
VSEVLEAYCIGWVDAGYVQEVNYEQMIQDMLSVEDDYGTFQSVDDLAAYVIHVDAVPVEEERPRNRNELEAEQAQRAAEVLRQMFTVYSHVFRIYGDALLDDILVRDEVYILRVPQDPNTLEWPTGNAQAAFENPIPSDLELPQEFYRILSWKVIQ